MALFSLLIHGEGIQSFVAQATGASPYDAIAAFLEQPCLNTYLSQYPDYPNDYSPGDIYIFIPLGNLPNAYFCGLGAKGKYVSVNIFQTVKRSTTEERYCGPHQDTVTLRQ